MTTPHTPPAALLDVAAIEARAAAASDTSAMDLSEVVFWLLDAVGEFGADHPWVGLTEPHSYRGYYEQLAFEVAPTTLGESLAAAQGADGAMYTGWKGGDYVMDGGTAAWVSEEGRGSGSEITGLLLDSMLSRASVPTLLAALRALAAQHAADVAAAVDAAARSTRESCAATLRARAECLRRYAYEATAKADAAEYAHDAREVDACAAIVASVALAAPTGGGE